MQTEINEHREVAKRWALGKKRFDVADDFAQDVALNYTRTYPFQTPLKYEWYAFTSKRLGQLRNTTEEFRAAKESLASPSLEPDTDKILVEEAKQEEGVSFSLLLGSLKHKLPQKKTVLTAPEHTITLKEPSEKYAVYHAVLHLKHQWGFTGTEIGAVFGRSADWASDTIIAAQKILRQTLKEELAV